MIKIFLESDKFSHKAGVTKHATNTMTRKSQYVIRESQWLYIVGGGGGGIEFNRECVSLLVDILGMNHKIMLHGWNGCGEVVRVWFV